LSKHCNIQIILRDQEPFEKMFQRWQKKYRNSKYSDEINEHNFFIKPSEKKRKTMIKSKLEEKYRIINNE
jgi:ribosomal protein S21